MNAVAPYKNKHNWNNSNGKGKGDVLDFYNHYFEKKAEKIAPEVLIREKPTSDTASLMVIDMQNDFIYLPQHVADPLKMPQGRFCVQNGLSIIDPLVSFIDTNATKFTKMVFTRDSHPIDHCSFFTNGGPFPPHCVANHYGAALHPAIKEVAQKHPNSVVTFKGCNSQADSFGAAKYSNSGYLRKRQLGSCCKDLSDDACMNNTGGHYLSDPKKQFEDSPFTSIPEYKDNSVDVLTKADCPESTSENMKKDLGGEFKIEHLLNEQTEGTHTVYVVGLAADFCVKDTAMNIMKATDNEGMLNGVKINVVVIQDLTRYVMLPLHLIKGTQSTNYTKVNTPKDINHYLFEYQEDGKVKLLSQAEAATADTSMVGDINRPTSLAAFTTPMAEILEDYKSTGVKVLMTTPTFAGGRRRKTRRSKKSKRKSRKHK
jgi:nicotinamidase-related amidase